MAEAITAVKLTKQCGIRGDHKVIGTVLSVGRNGDIDTSEAQDLIAFRKAVAVSGKGK
jgi:hypothetical protein